MPSITRRDADRKPSRNGKPKCGKDDLANLRASGLTLQTIKANALYTERDSAKLAEILNRGRGANCCLGGLVIPYRDLHGKVNRFARVRPHTPRVCDGKPIKYEQPKGSSPRAYFPAASLAKLNDGKSPVFITEGEKKALALSQLDVAAIGVGGVWCWKKKNTDELIDDLAAIDWDGRDVYIVFDYDEKAKTRLQVAAATRRLAKALRITGAKEAYAVDLPPGPGGGKQGVDDFLVANGAEGENLFHDLVEQAEPVPADDYPPMTKPSGRTDAANAARLVAKYRDMIRWVGRWDKWLIWDGRRWAIDEELQIQAFAKDTAADLWKEIADAAAGKVDSDLIKKMVPFATSSNSAKGIRNMVSLARSEPGTSIGIESLDTDPWLLNVENGTLDLRTGELRKHRQEDFLTKLAPVVFDTTAECPRWRAFLQTIFNGNDELIGYIQRLVGYCLTGKTTEHTLPFLHGTGANGKSTFCELLLKLLGADYAMKAPPDLLMARRGESHPTDRADLFGKRFVACVETEDGRRMAESLVKELTGGDRVRARRMREDFWEFTPTHHVWLAGNHKPTITGTDHGIWRRIKLIPFDVVIPDAEQDKELPEKLAAELPGILNWAIEGCLTWRRDGMREPKIVQAATKEYSDEMDEVGRFIDDHCQLGPEYTAPATELYQAFQRAMPNIRMTQHSFGASLRRRGFEKGRTNKGKHGWKGLRLQSEAEIEETRKKAQKFRADWERKRKKEGK